MNSEALNMYFRESFRGYRKEDVNEYIMQMNLKFSNREKEYKDKLEQLTSKLQEAEGSSSAASSALYSEIAKTKAECDTLRKEKAELLSRLERTEELYKAEFEGRSARKTEEESSKMSSEEMSAKIGNVLIVAQVTADKIVSDAKSEAETILAAARKEADEIRSAAEKKAEGMVDGMNLRIKEMSDSYISEFGAIINDIKDNFYKITESARGKADGVRKEITSMKTDMDKLIESDKQRILSDLKSEKK